MKKLLLVLILSVMLIAVASTSYAACVANGSIKTLNFVGTTATVYVGNVGAPSFYYSFTTTNLNYYHVLSGLLGKYVTINGSAATCPTSGVVRYGGVINYIYAFQ
jgi:hypothetical protein